MACQGSNALSGSLQQKFADPRSRGSNTSASVLLHHILLWGQTPVPRSAYLPPSWKGTATMHRRTTPLTPQWPTAFLTAPESEMPLT